MQEYFVLRCRPSRTIAVRDGLQAEFGEGAAVAPSYRATARQGRQRRRVEVEKAVVAGIVFASAEAKSACSCRSRPEDMNRAVPMLSIERDAAGDRHHVTVDAAEIEPLIEYATERDAAFGQRFTEPQAPQEREEKVEERVLVGARVRLVGGVLAGLHGVVVSQSKGEAAVELDGEQARPGSSASPQGRGGMFGSVVVPVALVEIVEVSS